MRASTIQSSSANIIPDTRVCTVFRYFAAVRWSAKDAVIVGGTAVAKLSQRNDIRFILNPFFQSKAIQGVYDIAPLFYLNASLRWTSANGKWSVIANGSNIFNGYANTRSMLGNQDYAMRVWMNYASASLMAVYRIGNFKEKKKKEVDTSRMGY